MYEIIFSFLCSMCMIGLLIILCHELLGYSAGLYLAEIFKHEFYTVIFLSRGNKRIAAYKWNRCLKTNELSCYKNWLSKKYKSVNFVEY